MSEGAGDMSRPARWAALAFSVAMIGLTLLPLAREHDSFPLSSYPMFSSTRGRGWLAVVVARDEAGNERAVPPRLVANAEVMQAAQTIANAVKRRQAPLLCERVATRLAEEDEWAHFVGVEVQVREFDPLTYFTEPEGTTPLRVRRRARCPIVRAGEGVEGGD